MRIRIDSCVFTVGASTQLRRPQGFRKPLRSSCQERSVFFQRPGLAAVSVEGGHQIPEILQGGFDVLDDVLGQQIGVGQVVQVGQAFVFEPEDIQIGLVAGSDFRVAEPAPATFRVLGRPGCAPPKAVVGVVAGDEVGVGVSAGLGTPVGVNF